MSTTVVRGPTPSVAFRLLRRIGTNNPFYVISAGLFLFGLRVSFGPQVRDLEVGILMAGLAGYTLLLATTGLTLVRFGNVWDDVRTVLLLIVLMFLATSVTFDELLVGQPWLAKVCQLGGFAFAVLLSEILLHGSGLTLRAWFRGPYYLILGLFFLYPLALTPLLRQPNSERLQWGLFGFSSIVGLAFLTLLPAIRRGRTYAATGNAPWRWPLYPWVLFGLLAVAAPARAWLLCFSMHWVNMAAGNATIFGGYFLAPLGLCLAVLLLEMGIVSDNAKVKAAALLAPLGCLLVTLLGTQDNLVFRRFFDMFIDRLGGDPLWITALGATLFYAYAASRHVTGAIGAVASMLFVLAFLGTDSHARQNWQRPLLWPLALAILLQVALGVWQRHSRPWIIAAIATLIVVTQALSERFPTGVSFAAALHAAIFVLAVGGVWCRDEWASVLRGTAGSLLFLMGTLFVLGYRLPTATAPDWVGTAYPLAVALLLGGYGLMANDRLALVLAALLASGWLIRFGWWGYRAARGMATGLDQIVLSLSIFGVAVIVSLAKSGRLSKWIHPHRDDEAESGDEEEEEGEEMFATSADSR